MRVYGIHQKKGKNNNDADDVDADHEFTSMMSIGVVSFHRFWHEPSYIHPFHVFLCSCCCDYDHHDDRWSCFWPHSPHSRS